MLDSISCNMKQDQGSYELCLSSLEAQLETLDYDLQSINNVVLVLEELLTNIIKYSGNHEEIKINLKLYEMSIIIHIEDTGKEFNPLKLEDPNMNLPLDDRQAGGLGVYIVKNISDDMRYYRIGNTNIVSLLIKVQKNPAICVIQPNGRLNFPKFKGVKLMTPETLDELFSTGCLC